MNRFVLEANNRAIRALVRARAPTFFAKAGMLDGTLQVEAIRSQINLSLVCQAMNGTSK